MFRLRDGRIQLFDCYPSGTVILGQLGVLSNLGAVMRIASYAKPKAALRKQVAGAGEDARTLFAADEVSKLRELRREAAIDPATTARATRPGPARRRPS